MTQGIKLFLSLLLAAGPVFGRNIGSVIVRYNNPRVSYMGRVKMDKDAAVLYWSGSEVSLNFEGTGVGALVSDEKGDNYYYVLVDSMPPVKLQPTKEKRYYQLATKLKNGKHNVHLYKLTDISKGKTCFYGFSLDEGNKVLEPTPPLERKMEIYGNSIASGYSIEDQEADSNASIYFNHYLSFDAITARHYHASLHCISKSGIGLMVSWTPPIMPEIYDRLDPEDSVNKWDFTTYTPDLVIIELLQNDSWLINKPQHAQFKARFGITPPNEHAIVSAYKKFILSVRDKYPNASIICSLGSMDAVKEDAPWTDYIYKAVKMLHDKGIYTYFFPYKKSPGHPKIKDQQAMADGLIQFIDDNIKW